MMRAQSRSRHSTKSSRSVRRKVKFKDRSNVPMAAVPGGLWHQLRRRTLVPLPDLIVLQLLDVTAAITAGAWSPISRLSSTSPGCWRAHRGQTLCSFLDLLCWPPSLPRSTAHDLLAGSQREGASRRDGAGKCDPFNPAAVMVRKIGRRWKIADGNMMACR